MSTQFFSTLSQNYIELLENDEYYDITIKVGEDSNVKIFRAHKSILCYRSSYLRRILSSKKNNNDNNSAPIEIPNISPENFQIILKYIYGGILTLNEQDTTDTLKVLIAADVLQLQELIDYLQKYLIESKSEWMEQHLDITYRMSLQSNNLLEIQQFCTNLMAKSPEKIFKSFDFTSLFEKSESLISLIKRDDLQMKEIEIWENVLEWGRVQNRLISDPDFWSDEDFKTMQITLQHCLPLIRFFSLSPKEFLHKVGPYRKLLDPQLYKDLLNSYLDPDIEPNDNISLPRNMNIDGIIDSEIVSLNIISIISRWIDKVEINNKFAYLRELYLPYKFELLLRGSRDGFTPNKFHTLCDDKPNTVAFLQIKGTEEVIGGYNPSIWKRAAGWGQTKYSFIFSFKNKNNLKDIILSNVKNTDRAVHYRETDGPYFGNDLVIHSSNEFEDYTTIGCILNYYEKKIRNADGDWFAIDDYEVFQIIRK